VSRELEKMATIDLAGVGEESGGGKRMGKGRRPSLWAC